MGNSRQQICIDPLPLAVAPARSCGPLGRNDAADPNALACMPGDTPGALGTCGDSGDARISHDTNICRADVPVLAVDVPKMRRLLYATAYAEAANDAATAGFWSSDVDLGDQRRIEAAASSQADRLMEALLDAMTSGPSALQTFIKTQEERKQAAASALKAKLDNALRAGRKSERRWGEAIKFCAGVKFVSTVTVKTLGVFTGWTGTAIDLVYGGVTDAANPIETKGILAVGADTAKAELVEKANELLAEHGLMSAVERRQIEGWLGNYQGNAEKIAEQLKKIEERLLNQIKRGKGVGGLMADRARKLAKLRKLRLGFAGKALRSAGSYKKALGATASVVFLAQDVAEAWSQLEKEYALAER